MADTITNDVNATASPDAPAAATNSVRCITELKPWANVLGGVSQGLRPIDLDEVVTVPAGEAQLLQKNRHAIIVG